MKNILSIFYNFLVLGFFSFGGPVAHLGYFRDSFVEKLKWLDDTTYSKIVALSQFLPGPSSSQVGFAIGLHKGGLLGAIVAFIAFTLPSFIFLYLASKIDVLQNSNVIVEGTIIGLKLFAVVIVADAIIGMYKSFCKDVFTIIIFIVSTFILSLLSGVFVQISVLLVSAILGTIFLKNNQDRKNIEKYSPKKKISIIPFIIFLVLLTVSIFPLFSNDIIKVFNAFFQAGSLVFGGGHVVLPLLEESLKGMIDENSFLVGYSLAQAVPGPMFTIATYLGANIFTDSPFFGALVATIAIFLPGFLLILTFWSVFDQISQKQQIVNAIAGVNASVVGLLFAVLITTIIPSTIYSLIDVLAVLIGFFIFKKFKIKILYMIILFIIVGNLTNLF